MNKEEKGSLIWNIRQLLHLEKDIEIISDESIIHLKVMGKPFCLYIKSLTYAGNPYPQNTTRAQLPKRDEFEAIKKDNSVFLFLGYDETNKVFACWDPVRTKERLNEKQYVSFFSRLNLQQSVTRGNIISSTLQNNFKYVLLKLNDLANFLLHITEYFPNIQFDHATIAVSRNTNGILSKIEDDSSVKLLIDEFISMNEDVSDLTLMSSCMNEFGEFYHKMTLKDWHNIVKEYREKKNSYLHELEDETEHYLVAEPLVDKYSSHDVYYNSIDEDDIELVHIGIPSADPYIEVEYKPTSSIDDDVNDILEDEEKKLNPIKGEDVEKLKHVFNKKSTSYKYFWFMALLEIYKETQIEKITFRQIIIKMVAKAWKYVFMLDGQFSQSDQLPTYLSKLKSITKLESNSLESEVENVLNSIFVINEIKSTLSPLLKNVPYRFLSPWIPFTDNDDVIEKSCNKELRCPYELYNDYVVISILWREVFINYFNSIQLFAEYSLETYLKIDEDIKESRDFYNTRFVSLNQLLRRIKRRKGEEVVKQFIEKYNFSSKGDITPVELMAKMPDSSCRIGFDGRKCVIVPGEMWSLKILDKLLSGEKLVDQYDNIQLFEEYGIKTYLKTQEIRKTQDLYIKKYISLNKLLKAIKDNNEEKVIKQFIEKYNFSSKGDITPAELMAKMPDSSCAIDSEGRKRVNVPTGLWSLKLLDQLLSG